MVGTIIFLTPLAGIVACALLIPLAAFTLAARREQLARQTLRLAAPPRARRLPRILALSAVPALLALAATQPALRSHRTLHVRTDAQILYVIDISRSMLASSSATAPTRLAIAKSDAIAMRDALSSFPSGVATFTNRILPDLLPNGDPAVFDDTVVHAVAIEEPPPSTESVVATTLGALQQVATQNFFPPTIKKRLVVLLTDGESNPYDIQTVVHALASPPGVKLILIHVSAPNETVYDQGRPETAYHEDNTSGSTLATLAAATHGHVYGEHALTGAIDQARADLGLGPTTNQGETQQTRTLAPYVALIALLPLLLIIWPTPRRRAIPPQPPSTRYPPTLQNAQNGAAANSDHPRTIPAEIVGPGASGSAPR